MQRNTAFILSQTGLTIGFKQASRAGENKVSEARLPRPKPGTVTCQLGHLGKIFYHSVPQFPHL